MMAFPSMIEDAAREAGMKIPDDVEAEFDPNEFPHWHVYCNLQLGRAVTWGNHWENAKIVANAPEDKIRTMTEDDFCAMGFAP